MIKTNNMERYRLTRLNDDKVVESKNVAFVKRERDGSYSILRTPEKGATCSMYNSMERLLRTSIITDFDIVDDVTTLFTTMNSKYKLENIK
jgi:hypothetical protein